LESEDFGRYLKGIRKAKKMTIRQLELYSQVSNAYISQLERGERGIPSPAIINKLSRALSTDYDEMMIKAGHMKPHPTNYGLEPYNTDTMVKLPILGTIRAGEPIDMLENIEGYEMVEPELLHGREGFVLKVKGDSMTGDYIFEGYKVVVVVQKEVESSEIAVVAVNGNEATLKRVKIQGDVCVLTSSNPAYEPMIYPCKDVHIIGKVVRFWKDI
jgi:repressor LexA